MAGTFIWVPGTLHPLGWWGAFLHCGSQLSGWGLPADGESELMGKFFLKIFFTPIVNVQNDQSVMGSF